MSALYVYLQLRLFATSLISDPTYSPWIKDHSVFGSRMRLTHGE